MRVAFLLLMVLPDAVSAETVVASQTIRPQQIITEDMVRLDSANINGAHSRIEEVVGQEAQYAIYPGRAVMRGATTLPALVVRNQEIELIYSFSGLHIVASGRALGRGAEGDRIQVMNKDSRAVLFGVITLDGKILVSN